MSSNNKLIDFIYELHEKNIYIWLQNSAIRVYIPNDVILTEDEKQFIKDYKPKIILLLNENKIYSKNDASKILKCNFETSYPLSYSQERLWFLEQFEHGNHIYNIPRVYRLSDNANVDFLNDSLNKVVCRHEILRSFIKTDLLGVGYQIPDSLFTAVPINMIQVYSHEELDSLINSSVNRIFDLENEYPINITFYNLVRIEDKISDWYLSIVFHHIAFDGWSMGLFIHELTNIYFSLLNPCMQKLPELEIQYKDFSVWQRKHITEKSLVQQLSYWQDKLNGYEILCLPQSKDRPDQMDYMGENIYFELNAIASKNLRSVSEQLNISLYTLLLSGYFILLNHLTNQNDIVIGTVIANRPHEQVENLMGFFVNSLALRINIKPEEKFTDFIKSLSNDVLNAKLNQDVPFEKLIDYLNVAKDTSRHPLFQVMFVTYGFESETSYLINEVLQPHLFSTNDEISKFDLTTTWDESDEKLKCGFNYRSSVFSKITIEKYIDIYKQILLLISDDISSKTIENLTINYLIDKINVDYILPSEVIPYPSEKTLFSLFDEQALLTPQAIAITDAKLQTDYSYKELAFDVEKMASHLFCVDKKSKSQLIGILSEKGYNHAVATLSIMKSGHAYLPLHHAWPINHINEVLIQGGVSILLVSRSCFSKDNLDYFLGSRYNIIIIEDLLCQLRGEISAMAYLPLVLSNDIAYVIFTSGSTGKPKGVTISHRGAVNTLYAVNQKFSVNSCDIILALSELSFDLSVYDLFGVLAVGGRVVFPNSEHVKDPAHWVDLINNYKISIWDSVPQLAGLLVEETEIINSSLRLFLLSGDWIPLKLPEQIKSKYPKAKVISLGGATEGSIWSIWYEIGDIQRDWNSIPYGIAMPNQNMLVLNESHKLCQPGIIGEIYIGGEGVALNYWGESQRTSNSFMETQYGRIYKTGDLGRWNDKGYIEFIGRKDSQVKLNGYRVELDEISIHISHLEGITDAVSLFVKRDGQEFICSYYVGIEQEEAAVLEKLKLLLPEYMIPTLLIFLERMPLTSNGKIDRQRLPYPDLSYKQNIFSPPRNSLEAQMCDIFSQILNIKDKQIGIHDDFFKLGGDSISSIRLVSLLRKNLGISVTAKNVFSCRNVAKLYEQVLSNPQKNPDIQKLLTEQGILTGQLGLLPIQQWFFSSQPHNINHFNQSFLIKVPCLDVDILQESLNKLIEYHDALRLRYKPKNAEYIQYYSDNKKSVKVKTFDIRSSDKISKTLTQILTGWQSEFNLVEGPLCSVGYINGYEDDTARIHIAIHHLLIDTVSWRSLASDLKLIYESISTGIKLDLGAKGTSYRQWVELIHQYHLYNQPERKYWQKVIDDYNKSTPLDKLIKPINCVKYAFSCLDKDTTQALLVNSNRPFNTEISDLLLTALAYALAEMGQNRVNYITLEGHGREEIYEGVDISSTLGWFTIMYPVRLEANTSSRMAANIKLIKENLRRIPNKGIGYGALIGYEEQELPKITFNYLGQFEHHDNNDWSILSEYAGESVSKENSDPGIISINAAIIEGQFEISFKCKLDQIKTDFLANQYIYHLKQLITYLTITDAQEYTMSDYMDFEPHVIIESIEQNKPPLFIFPPGVGGYECYLNNIVPALDLNLILFNNFNFFLRENLSPDSLNHLCFENLAETYIAHMKTIQPTGPYMLFGWSFGGVLAFEITRQLVLCGDQVSQLFMVDSYFKVKEAFKKLNIGSNEIETVGHLNHKYTPEKNIRLDEVNISLIKAIVDHEGDKNELFNHYVRNEPYNSLDQIISKQNINLKTIQASHFSWVDKPNVVKEIAIWIKNLMVLS